MTLDQYFFFLFFLSVICYIKNSIYFCNSFSSIEHNTFNTLIRLMFKMVYFTSVGGCVFISFWCYKALKQKKKQPISMLCGQFYEFDPFYIHLSN